MPIKNNKGFYYTFLATILWAISIILLKIILKNGENTYNVLFWTTFFALPFWLSLLFKRKNELKKLQKNDYLLLFTIGIISSFLVNLSEFLALKYSTSINYAFLIRTVILFTFLFAYLFLGEKFTAKKIILAILILFGSYLLASNGKIIYLSKGDIFTLLEAALLAFGNTVLGKIAIKKMSSTLSSSGSFLFGFIPIIAFTTYFGKISIPQNILAILLLAIIYAAIVLLRFKAYQNATASYITMIFSLTPVFVSFLAIPILNESMTSIQIIGGIFIVSAGIMVEKLKI